MFLVVFFEQLEKLKQNAQKIKHLHWILYIMSQLKHSIPLLPISRMKQTSERTQQLSMMKKQSKIQQQIKISIAVWNLQGMLPPSNSVKLFMDDLQKDQGTGSPDIVFIATQECQRSIGMSFFCENKQEWENCIKTCAQGYKLVESQTMRALHTAVLVKQEIADCFTTEKKTVLKAGTCNLMGNKGAINLVVNLLGQNIQFINCHLQAHQDQCEKRNQVLLRIADNMVEKDYRNQVFICGDLNYRIDMTHQQYYEFVKDKNNTQASMQYSKLLYRDQLTTQQILKQKFFPFYKEGSINFPPTYKISDNNQEYDKKRIPGWTDRIFHRKGRAKQVSYRCMYELLGTDHRPVVGTFKVETQETLSIFPEEFVSVKGNKGCQII